MKPEQTITIPVPKYREDVSYFGYEGHEYYFTDTNYNYNGEGWRYHDRFHGQDFRESDLDEWIGETERNRVHAEEDARVAEWHKKWMENNKRQNIMKEALK